ncbi:MAG: thioredoxin family protein, partial [Candidatus Melainabacteria bacterium]|nr:thioredoxin family protein [Candidatus Melainabacteria bacterium]
VKFVTIDVDQHPALALAFNISRLPTLVVKQPGVEDVLVARGLLEREDLKRFLEEGLKPVQPSGK